MKRVVRNYKTDYEEKLDKLIRPNEEELFDSIESAREWLQEVIDLEDASNNSVQTEP